MLSPLQVGVGVRNGAEAAAHAARIFLKTAEDDEVFFKIDFKNAFSTVRPDVILETVSKNYQNYCRLL